MKLRLKQFIDSAVGIPLARVNLIAAFALGKILKRDHSLSKPPSAILFIKIMGLGSVFMASDAILAIKHRYPNATLYLLCNRGLKEGLEPLEIFDKYFIIDDRSIVKMIRSTFAFLLQIWRVKNLWVIDLEVYSKLTTILSLWTLAKNRIGFYLNEVSFREKLNTHHVYFNQFCLVEENYQRMASLLDVNDFQQFVFPKYKNSLQRQSHQKTSIAINNTCSELGRERIYPKEKMLEVINWIIQHSDYDIHILGAPGDFTENQYYIENIDSTRVYNISGKLDFSEYYDFLFKNVSLLITIDSAPLHIARKLHIPTLSIWGPTAPQSRIVEDQANLIVYNAVSCSPCVHFTDKLPCGGDNFCMKEIQPNRIITQLIALLEL